MARARTVRAHPINVTGQVKRLTEQDERVVRLVAEHDVFSTEQLAALCFDRADRPADALPRLNYLATRALLIKYEHPGTHPAGFPGDDLDDTPPAGMPDPAPDAWPDGQRWVWSLGQGGAYWAGVERVLNRHAWFEAWTRSFHPEQRPHLRRRLAFNGFFAALHHYSLTHPDAGLDQWWGPDRCAEASRGQVAPDAHGRWRQRGNSVPFWLYSDYVRDPMRTLVATVDQHTTVHRSNAADRDVILLVMVNDNREALLHQRWATYAPTGKPTPRVATTSYRKLRAWPTDAIWWPVGPRADAFPGSPAQARRLHQLARQGPPIQPATAGNVTTGGPA